MPILDPSLVLTLLDQKDPLEYKSKSFIIKYLRQASQKKNSTPSLEEIESQIQFKKDLISGLSLVNSYYESKMEPEDITGNNLFGELYSRIDVKFLSEQSKFGLVGTYYLYGSNLQFFQPCLENDLRSWYLTSTKVAILCISTLKQVGDFDSQYLKLFCIEIDIMISCGYSVVICVNYDLITKELNQQLNDLFKSHHFSEIHLILDLPKKDENLSSNLDDLLTLFNDDIDKVESYFYLYSPYFNDLSENAVKLLQKLKQKPFFESFSFSKPVKESIKKSIKLQRSNHFVFTKSGFNTNLIFVQMQNVPLYDTEDEEDDFTPSKVSGFTTAYMTIQEFMNWRQNRVKILFNDEENNNDFVNQYVDFDDLHIIKIGSYVSDTLYLTKTAKETLDSVDLILQKQFEKFYKKDDFRKESIFALNKNKIQKFLTYVSYAYSKHEILKNPEFRMHKNQIFTAFEACQVFLNESKGTKVTNSGIIYQVETGEGKSCIICLIASLLALMKKTVHITSSNITLANRDYHESYNFFKMLGLKSAVLLHYNELPIRKDLKKSTNENQEESNEKVENNNEKEKDKDKEEIKEVKEVKEIKDDDDNDKKKKRKSKERKKSKDKEKSKKKNKKDEDNENESEETEKKDNDNDNENESEEISTDKKDEEIEIENQKEKVKDNSNEYTYNPDYFPPEFFHKKLFENSSNMNFSVCGISNENVLITNKANIVFSTFVNFESLYLRLMEIYPGEGNRFFGKCSLIIDEADSILIDELTNGTILSRSMKTNGSEVLKFVYKCYLDKKSIEQTYQEVKKEFPKCSDLKVDHIKDMFSQITLVNQDEFQDGKKYSIETKYVKEKMSFKTMLDNSKELFDLAKEKMKDTAKKGFKKLKENVKKHRKSSQEVEDVEEIYNDEDEDNNNDSEEVYADVEVVESSKKKKHDKKKHKEEKEHKKKSKKEKSKENIFVKTFKKKVNVYKEIVPFDYDHKGVLEPNKEFSGFVQQFIAIKEMFNKKENENMIIKDVSMNYLYVSHPIFVDLYGGVCGLTGTIGNFYDKKLFKEQYKLTTKKIPRNKPNLRIEYPVVLCDDIVERNHKIASEVIDFNKKGNPVLVIFQDLNEISALFTLLTSQGIKNINIFDGKDEKIKPDRIAGLKGAVSLGTNVCGRGTDIKNPAKPLHVIITYFTSNTRVMNQAFGRTARQGQEGSVRIICLKDQYVSPIAIFNRLEMEDVLGDFRIKNNLQISFINRFKSRRKWIFEGGIKEQKLTEDQILELRKTKININRLNVFNFEFPICMRITTFLSIQAQKIFSLYNCPNCKYTWILFQKYVREMILESWSMFIEETERKYFDQKHMVKFEDYLNAELSRLYQSLFVYLPELDDPNECEIVPTFMKIFTMIRDRYELKILSVFPEKLNKFSKQFGKQQYVTFNIGFKPYSLIDESGARINFIDGEQQGGEQTFIQDPELKYIRKYPHHRFSPLSITERVDDLFNLICKKINDVLGSRIGLKFFLRRTLGGCEFGICYDFEIECKQVVSDLNCLVDKDPLLLFTITVKSMVPILAGILIILLVYVASIAKDIAEWVTTFPAKLSKEIVVKTLKELAKHVVDGQVDKLCQAVISFLQKKLAEQIATLQMYNPELADIFTLLLKISAPMDFSKAGDRIVDLLSSAAEKSKNQFFSSKFVTESIEGIPIAGFLKIGFLALLCLSAFMLNFSLHRQAVKYNSEKAAAKFDEKQDVDDALNQNDAMLDKDKVEFIDATKVGVKLD